ncbi:unnamed protein product [Dicrocoelium dendriticum]|nr:unnamed protein product [Dicrocoelium dendriticum]
MAPLTKAQVDNLLDELRPHVNTDQGKVSLGIQAYRKFFTAYPQHINLFSRLQGLDVTNVFQSEGIKHYARALIDGIVKIVNSAAEDAQFKNAVEANAVLHATRNVTKNQFMSAEPFFIEGFKSVLTKQENKDAMEKLMKIVFSTSPNYLP